MRKPIKILLIEVPAVAVELDGSLLGEVVLNHVKYPQLLLAANLLSDSSARNQFTVEIADLKATLPRELTNYRTIDYQGRRMAFWRIGAPFDVLEEKLSGVSIIGISASFTFERAIVIQTIQFLRKRTQAHIVIGGHDATADPKYYLERGADLCVLGEGETALQEIALALADGNIQSVQGIAFVENGQMRKTGKRHNHDLSTISYPGTLMAVSEYNQCPDGPLPEGVDSHVAVIETSRGCNERCSFCDSSFIVGAYRAVTTAKLASIIKELQIAGRRTILFADDNLLYRMLPKFGGHGGREDLLVFFRTLFDAGFAWTFYNGLQFGLLESDGNIDQELIQALFGNDLSDGHLRGCFRAYIPLEKFTEPEMSMLPKLKALSVERDILATICKMKVPEVNLGFIIASIRETPSSLRDTVVRAQEFGRVVSASSNGASLARFFPWCSVPIPGTPDHRDFKPNIVYSELEYPELFSNYTSVLKNDHYSPLEFTLMRIGMSKELNGGEERLHTVGLETSSQSAV